MILFVVIPLVGAVIGCTVYIILRRRGAWGQFLPASAAGPGWTARIAETLAMACVGLLLVSLQVPELLKSPHVVFKNAGTSVVAGCLVAGTVLAVTAAMLWRTAAGVIVMVLASSVAYPASGWLEGLFSSRGPQPTPKLRGEYCFDLSGKTRIEGAELWINGVCLGEMPVFVSHDEFTSKVPYWPEPPKEIQDGTDEVRLPQYNVSGVYHRKYHQWIRLSIQVPLYASAINPTRPTYYARVKLGDEWGHWMRRFGGETAHVDSSSVSSAGKDVTYWTWKFSMFSPSRKKKLETLLDKARLADYRVDANWFKAMDTYGDDGWEAARIIAAYPGYRESQMANILNAWATWRYGLDHVKDTRSAWEVFERICDETDKRRYHLTTGIGGRAVELLVPHLDPKQLAKRAERLISAAGREYPLFSYASIDTWQENRRWHFGTESRSAGLDRRPGRSNRPASIFTVAHAVWKMDQHLDALDDSKPNIVERRIPVALLRKYVRTGQHQDDNLSIWDWRLLDALGGGEEIDRFLLRQEWRPLDVSYGSGRMTRDGMRVEVREGRRHDMHVNRWLYLLANRHSPTGREFRDKHSDLLFELADAFPPYIMGSGGNEQRHFDFLFLDLDPGEQSLAARYWPRFRERTIRMREENLLYSRKLLQLSALWRYLVKMEPIPTAEMYAESWRLSRAPQYVFLSALSILRPPPLAKRKEIVEALTREVERDISNIRSERGGKWGGEGVREAMLEAFDRLLAPDRNEYWARQYLEKTKGEEAEKWRKSIADFLNLNRAHNELVPILAKEDDPALRIMVMGALKSRPTPAYREILNKLLEDPDEKVRAAAREVEAYLKELAATPAAKFAEAN